MDWINGIVHMALDYNLPTRWYLILASDCTSTPANLTSRGINR